MSDPKEPKRTLIQQVSSSLVEGMLQKVEALSTLEHGPTTGQLKELFVSNILKLFLATQYDVCPGIVVDHGGMVYRLIVVFAV